MPNQYVFACLLVDPSLIDPAPGLRVSWTVLALRANVRIQNVGLENGKGKGAEDAGSFGEASENLDSVIERSLGTSGVSRPRARSYQRSVIGFSGVWALDPPLWLVASITGKMIGITRSYSADP
jgi:hypothetical protein